MRHVVDEDVIIGRPAETLDEIRPQIWVKDLPRTRLCIGKNGWLPMVWVDSKKMDRRIRSSFR